MLTAVGWLQGIITYLVFKNLEESIDEALDKAEEGLMDWHYLRGKINVKNQHMDRVLRR